MNDIHGRGADLNSQNVSRSISLAHRFGSTYALFSVMCAHAPTLGLDHSQASGTYVDSATHGHKQRMQLLLVQSM